MQMSHGHYANAHIPVMYQKGRNIRKKKDNSGLRPEEYALNRNQFYAVLEVLEITTILRRHCSEEENTFKRRRLKISMFKAIPDCQINS